MNIKEKAELWADALSIRCDRCENSNCGHFSPDPIEGMCKAIKGDSGCQRSLNLALTGIIAWASHGFCAYEAAQWNELGVFRAEGAHRLLKAGVSLYDLRCIIERAIRERESAASQKQKTEGCDSYEVRKRGEDIPKAAARRNAETR